MNSAEFLVIWLGLWCIGCAPAMLNFNLKKEALVHCLRVCGARVLVVDVDTECRERFEECRGTVEGELGVSCFYLDEGLEGVVGGFSRVDPGNGYRDGVRGGDPVALLYTRFVFHFFYELWDGIVLI